MSLDRARLDRIMGEWAERMAYVGASPAVCIGVVEGPPLRLGMSVVAGYDDARLLALLREAVRCVEAGAFDERPTPPTLRLAGEGTEGGGS